MAGIDIRTFDFDWALTFSALLMNADGTVYHRYGSRDASGPMSHLSVPSFVRVLDETLADHAAYRKNPRPAGRRAFTVEQQPYWKRRIDAGKRPDCFHCHMVGDGHNRGLQEKHAWRDEMAWRYPPPDRIGLHLDRDDQTLVTTVAAGTPAAAAGLVKGDRLVRVDGRSMRTMADVAFALDRLDGKGAAPLFEWTRGGEPRKSVVRLGRGWRVGKPRDLAWRIDMWVLSPKPGFGGRMLPAARKKALGVDAKVGALEITYLVTWGEWAHTGHNARKAGLRKGDVVLSVDGYSGIESPSQFHAWFRLTQQAGRKVDVRILRDGKPRTLLLPVVD